MIVTVYVPGLCEVDVSVEIPGCATATAVGTNVLERPNAGLIVAESCTFPVNPFDGVTVTVLRVTVPTCIGVASGVASTRSRVPVRSNLALGTNAPVPCGVPRPVGPS